METMPHKPVAPKVEVQISYCPELGIYHYVRSDGTEYFFDRVKLEESLTLYRSQHMEDDVNHMMGLTTAAMAHPHKIVIFEDVNTPPRIVDPVLHSFGDSSEDEAGPEGDGRSGKQR